MSNLDLVVSEVLEEMSSCADTSNEKMLEVLIAYNSDIHCMGQKLKMIAWDRQ